MLAKTLMLSNGSPAKYCVNLLMLTNSPCLRVVHGVVFSMYYAEGHKSCVYEIDCMANSRDGWATLWTSRPYPYDL